MLSGVGSAVSGARLNQHFREGTSMTMYRVDLAAGEVEELTPQEEELRRIQARLRKLAVKIDGAPDGPDKAELRKKYRALQEKLRELGGDAPVRENYPGDELTAAVDAVVADFTGAQEEQQPAAADPSGGEDRTAEGSYAGLEEFIRKIAAEDDGSLPESVREDAELQHALRAQAHEEHFGEAEGDDLTDDEAWAEYCKALGMEEG
jgi:hypothetical protein